MQLYFLDFLSILFLPPFEIRVLYFVPGIYSATETFDAQTSFIPENVICCVFPASVSQMNDRNPRASIHPEWKLISWMD